MTDFEAIWFGQGAELARRMVALATEMDIEGESRAAAMVRNVLDCEYNPLPDRLPALGDPPARVRRRAFDPGA